VVPVIGFQKSIELGRWFHRSFVGQANLIGLERLDQHRFWSIHIRSTSTSAESLPKAQARENWVLTDRVLLFFGFVREYKGLRYLLEGLPQILKRFSIHLIIAGEVWGDKKLYLELVRKLDLQEHVTFVHEYIPNEKVECYFAAADLVAIPYVSATQSGIVQLAFGFAKPVIVGRVGGLTEVLEHQKTGYLVPRAIQRRLQLQSWIFMSSVENRRWSTISNSRDRVFLGPHGRHYRPVSFGTA
jgi:glycosyltransferase involved in cell wall biosynthesis